MKAIGKPFPPAIPKVVPRVVPPEAKRNGRRGYKNWAIVSTGVAACLTVAVGFLGVRGPGERPTRPTRRIT